MEKLGFMQIYKKIKILFNNMSNDHVSEYSAQCAYYTILSFIPFIILLITLIQYTNIDKQTLFNVISKIIPDNMNEIVLGIIQEVYSKSIGTISISIIFTLWSAGRGLYALTKGLKEVYNTEKNEIENYIYLRIKAIMQTIIFIILIVTGLAFLVFGNSLISIIQDSFGIFTQFNSMQTILAQIGFIIVTFIVFLMIYKFIPKHKITFKSQIYGSLFGAFALNIVSLVFSKYLDIFKGFSITYGSLTTLMLVMMWVYACFYIVFLGAELNKIVR